MPVIDLKHTGQRIGQLMEQHKITVRELQNKFGFATPQAIYKWLHGTCLPTVDNLLILASIFQVRMDEILEVDYVY